MSDMDLNRALDTVADAIAAEVLDRYIDHIDWSEYPGIGEYDWERVIERAGGAVNNPLLSEYESAMAFLSSRATRDPDGASNV